jgi:hypothetical protein
VRHQNKNKFTDFMTPAIYSRQKKIISSTVIAVLAIFILFPVLPVEATGAEKALKGLNKAAGWGFLGQDVDSDEQIDQGVINDLPLTIGQIIGAVLSLIGLVFLVLLWWFSLDDGSRQRNKSD